ncbi:MAG TPA: hypothetical protein VJ732_06790 [Bryobacteraceae bacterium]|nr:hypothetical protein [Bryobacteraceae bacterium]
MMAPAFAGDSLLVVDRALPQVNLNNSSGPVRSNVRWADDQGFLGDTFAIGNAGERWVIDSIRTWTVPGGGSEGQPQQLGDFYQDVRLYFGSSAGDLTPVVSGQFTAGSSGTSNANIQVTDATQNGASFYDDFGTNLRIWQVDFTNLNLAVDGGTKYSFGVWGMGRQIPGTDGKIYRWFNHASNSGLSGNAQQGADGTMFLFDTGGRAAGSFQAQGSGWDKNSDINVQIFAHRVSANSDTQ